MAEEGTPPVESSNETAGESTETVASKADSSGGKTFDAEYVKTLRDEAARHRTEKQRAAKENADLLAKIAEYENAQLSEAERSQKSYQEAVSRAESFEARARELEVSFQLAMAAASPENHIGDVRAAIKLLDRDTLEFDDNGRITNLQDALETLKAEYPSVVSQAKSQIPTAPHTGTTNPAKASTGAKYTREDLRQMSPERVVELQQAGELNHLLGG